MQNSSFTVETSSLGRFCCALEPATALIKKFRSSENDGGLNCANGRALF
jgi:hypothetical protein